MFRAFDVHHFWVKGSRLNWLEERLIPFRVARRESVSAAKDYVDEQLGEYYDRYHWELDLSQEPQFPRPDPNEPLSPEKEEAKALHVEQMRGQLLFRWWNWRAGKLDDTNKRLDMPLCQLLEEVSSAGGKGTRTVRTRARTAYQLWSKEFFKDDIIEEFEQYFKKLDRPDSERAGCRTRWTKDYFQNLSDEVRARFEAQALAEKD
ncbi:hypothetical protein ARMSODRAFT_1027150 [Armillaria solidipes]|uniref:Uncharacterized protein n=1 Tax=Armillaria solidipes TaxID=1076256 RepID=A0A2H3ALE9_9AGAR|nr:hypothetical protein ARMSODRAFT_1027150 [Armillaria solidipes]